MKSILKFIAYFVLRTELASLYIIIDLPCALKQQESNIQWRVYFLHIIVTGLQIYLYFKFPYTWEEDKVIVLHPLGVCCPLFLP